MGGERTPHAPGLPVTVPEEIPAGAVFSLLPDDAPLGRDFKRATPASGNGYIGDDDRLFEAFFLFSRSVPPAMLVSVPFPGGEGDRARLLSYLLPGDILLKASALSADRGSLSFCVSPSGELVEFGWACR